MNQGKFNDESSMGQSIASIKRLRQIATVFFRHGFEDLLERLGLAKFVSKLTFWRTPSTQKLTTPERFCKALFELGPTFTKLGQVLATRVDLLSPEWTEALKNLQDDVPSLPYSAIKLQLKHSLGASPEKVFKSFDKNPLAAGSIAQVHRAVLKDGTDVIVKILRPGIEKTIEADISLLLYIAKKAEQRMTESTYYRPVDVVNAFAESIRKELDLQNEIKNLERFASNFKNSKTIIIPKAYPELSSKKVNVQEFIAGIPGRDTQLAERSGLSLKKLCQRGSDASLKSVFTDGFFHADPHPGNVFYLPGDRIAYIDFGMMGYLSQTRRRQVTLLMHAIVEKNTRGVIKILENWNGYRPTDGGLLEADVDLFLDSYYGLPLKDLNMSQMLLDLTGILRKHHVILPAELTMLIKVFITLEGFARNLNPDYDLISSARPFLEKAFLEKYNSENVQRSLQEVVIDTLDIAETLPYDLRKVMRIVERGNFGIVLDEDQSLRQAHSMIKAGKLLATALLASGFGITSAILLNITHKPMHFAIILSAIGFAIAGLGVASFAFQFLKKRI